MRLRVLIPALLLAMQGTFAMAQSYPDRMVTIVVPFPAGGGIDVLVRSIAAELTTKWKQPVIIENKPGAGSLIGAGQVSNAAADGYTLMATVNQTMTTNPFLYKKLPYDPVNSFAPIQLMVQSDMLILANPSVPANNLKELLALVKKEPQKHNFGSFGMGSQPHLMFEHFNKMENIDLLHVPFSGIAPLLTAVTGGHVEMTTGSAGVGGQLIRGGKLKALAVVGKERLASFPDVPTAAESGFPYLRASIWYALFAPKNTPAAIVDKIHNDIKEIITQPEFAERHVTSKGLRLMAAGPAELAKTIVEETAATAEMVKIAGVQPE